MFALSFQRYIDENGNKWHSASPLQGTGFGYAEYNWLSDAIRSDNFMSWGDNDGEGFGGGGGGGGGWISLAAVRQYFQRVWGSMGRYNINASHSGGIHTGIGFNVTYMANEIHSVYGETSDVVFGSMFITTERMGQLLGGRSAMENMGIFVNMSGLTLDATIHGFNSLQRLANKYGPTKYPIQNIGKYKLVSRSIRVLNTAGVLLTLYDIKENGLNADNGTDLGMSGVGAIPVVGWGLSAAYFIGRMLGFNEATDKAIYDLINKTIKESEKHFHN